MNSNSVGWFEIYVQDMDRAKSFYETVFDVKLTQLEVPDPNIEMWSFPMIEGATGCPGALAKMEGVDSGGSGIMIYFSSADCAVEASRVTDAGGKLQQEKMSIGEYGFIAMAVDTEGNMIGIHSMD